MLDHGPFTDYERPEDKDIVAFQEVLMGYGIHTVARLNRGGDIDAACGQLRLRAKNELEAQGE